mgnify:FL=1|jgi:hypothetical protein|tara:strand:- start:4065 stop:4439 length:375 start_codon:yes stop_codon:yes gene_type:complete
MDDHKALRNLREEIKKKNEESYRDNSKKRLINNVDKKFKTTMIGSLAVFEKYFGALWGHGDSSLTEEQKHFRQLWEDARTDILNNGNTQMRIAQEEIAQYTMTWNRYKTEFIVTKDPKKDIENE